MIKPVFIIGIVFIVVLVLTIVLLSTYLKEIGRGPDKGSAEEEDYDVTVVAEDDAYYSPVSDIGSKIAESPWLEEVAYYPPNVEPSQERLDSLYKQLRTAYYNQDYNGFNQIASSELGWMVEQNMSPLGITKDGIAVQRVGDITGVEYFENNSRKLISKPNYFSNETLIAESMDKIDISGGDTKYILLDEKTGEEKLIKYSDYSDVYVVCYLVEDLDQEIYIAKDDMGENCHNIVSFVYELGKWKVLNYSWNIIKIE